jgi:hypothetical protein
MNNGGNLPTFHGISSRKRLARALTSVLVLSLIQVTLPMTSTFLLPSAEAASLYGNRTNFQQWTSWHGVAANHVPYKTSSGTAEITANSDTINLTQDSGGQTGFLWNSQTYSYDQDLTVSANYFLGAKDGADGIMFAMRPLSQWPNGGTAGAATGNWQHWGTGEIRAVFDTYPNSPERADDHLRVQGVTTAGVETTFTGTGVLLKNSSGVDITEVENNQNYPFTIRWTAATRTFAVFAGLSANHLIYSTVITSAQMNSTQFAWGWMGWTGGASNFQAISDVTYHVGPTVSSSDTDMTVIHGASVTLNATSTSSESSPTRRWEVSTNGGSTWTSTGISTSAYTFTADRSFTQRRYRFYIESTAVGITYTKTTTPITLTVLPPILDADTDTAMSFNGTSHYLRAPDANSLDITDSITVQAWVFQTASIGTGWNMVLNKENSYELGTISGTWWYGLRGQGGSWSGVDTKVPSKLNEWQHIAFTRAAGSAQVNFYLNGDLVFTGSADGAGGGFINNSADSLTISGRDFGNGSISSYFQGHIDELRIFASNRTQQQILADMNSYGPINTSSLRLYYDFNEGSGSTIYNRVAGALAESDLTRYNSTPWDESRIMASTTNGPYSVRTFNRSYLTSFGGWKAPRTVRSSILTVAGGGGGGSRHAGGGGGGGVSYAPTYLLTAASTYEIQIGVGGIGYGQPGNNAYLSGTTFVTWAGGNTNGSGTSGKNSILRPANILESITAIGGGGGGGVGVAGGSGGGSNGSSSSPGAATGYSTAFFTAYGNAGGFGYSGAACGADYCGGGGGGAGSAGGIPLTAGLAATDRAGNGGDGLPFSTSAQTATYYGGGGGGGAFNSGLDSAGGLGGGAAGGRDSEGAHGTYALGGGGGGGGFNGMTSYRGGNGGSGVIVIRWITATAPTFTPPVIAYLNAGMTETFTTNVAQDSATAMLTRTFRWESSTTGVSGTYSVIKQGTGASNAFFSWVPSDTSTSGSTFAYRVIVTDSDTAGLFIVETSTPVWAIINRPLNVAGSSSFAKAINLAKSETYTITLGTSTYRSTLSPVIPGITLDTSTAGLAVIRIAETVTVGTYYETLTVTDSVSAVVTLPLTINVSAPPTLLNSSEIVSNNLILHLDAGNSQSLIAADTTTVTSTLWRDLSGNGKHGQTTGTGTFNGGSCSAPTYYRDFGGYLNFNGSGQCYWVPYLGTHARNSISVEAWFRSPTTTIAAGAALFGQAYPISSQNIDISLGSADSALTSFAIGVYNGASTTWQRSGGYTPTINTWTHLVGTYDGNNFRIYANGSLVVTTPNTNSTSLLAGDENLSGYFIGRRFDGSNSYTGDMASIRVYGVPLTLGEVQQNYNATKERFLSSNINMVRLTQKYGAKQQETFTVTSGFGSKTRVLTTGNRTGIAWDTATANTVVLAIQESLTVGTYSDTITVTDSLNQSSFLPITMSIAKADTITVTVRNSKTFVYTGSAPTSLPDITITGLVSSDTGTATRLFSAPASRVGAPETYTALVNSSSVPIDVETYTVTAATPVLSVGSLSNYEGVINNETTTLQITQANQAPLRIAMYGASVGSPHTITTDGGSGGGLVTETITAGSTASNCAISSRVLTMTSTVSSYCNILVTKAATRNFKVETVTAQITFFLFIPTASAPAGGGPAIGIGGINTVTVDAVGAPTINSLSATTISLSAGGSLTISGSGFGSTSLTVKFWRDKSVTITPSNGSTIVVPVADIAAAGGQTGRITVITIGGAAVSVERLTITP